MLSLLLTNDTSKVTRQGGESRVAVGRTGVLAIRAAPPLVLARWERV